MLRESCERGERGWDRAGTHTREGLGLVVAHLLAQVDRHRAHVVADIGSG